ncbi:ABC transporter permease [Pontibacter ramchanderi]|uniref:Transport permease protein n=1 Tax=Pontibacter ramchanderi TaxID=1179743 RepID=A0A2N3U7P8_9BACT|nr:ABC transporter permease [Pontibacter ramchanderi]PKV62780.1 lipopolysaccharide transport system permease protein [Pontibacter ramchanderi]
MSKGKAVWDWEINSKTSFWGHGIPELWSYRHLMVGLVRRHFLLNYQQTVLGPLWILFQPILTLFTYVLVFNKIVGIQTGSIPPVVFYASGIVLWNFFSESFTGTASTFKDNAQLFGKVYFPRIIMPISVINTHALRLLIQLLLLFMVVGYYSIFSSFSIHFNIWILAFPFTIILIGIFGLALGLLFSVITAKYRDITNLVTLGVRLFMFITPVIYPLSTVPENLRWLVQLNPLTPLFELFRLSLLGEGYITSYQLLYSVVITLLVLVGATLLFNKQGDKLIDVV